MDRSNSGRPSACRRRQAGRLKRHIACRHERDILSSVSKQDAVFTRRWGTEREEERQDSHDTRASGRRDHHHQNDRRDVRIRSDRDGGQCDQASGRWWLADGNALRRITYASGWTKLEMATPAVIRDLAKINDLEMGGTRYRPIDIIIKFEMVGLTFREQLQQSS